MLSTHQKPLSGYALRDAGWNALVRSLGLVNATRFILQYESGYGEYAKIDGFVKSPSAALRFTFVAAAYLVSTPLSSGFARLAYGTFYFAIPILTFYEIIKIKRELFKSKSVGDISMEIERCMAKCPKKSDS